MRILPVIELSFYVIGDYAGDMALEPDDSHEMDMVTLFRSSNHDAEMGPLLYRFRVIDRLPEPPSPAAARGTLVHAVLERLFDEPASPRTPQAARGLVPPQWAR